MWSPRGPSYAARMWYEGKVGEPLRAEAVLWALRLLLQLSFLFLLEFALFQYVTMEFIAPAPVHPRWARWVVVCWAVALRFLFGVGSLVVRPETYRVRSLVWFAAVTARWASLVWAGSEFV